MKDKYEESLTKYIIDGDNATISDMTLMHYSDGTDGYFVEFISENKKLE